MKEKSIGYSRGEYVVHLAEAAKNVLQNLAAEAGRQETGGILIGYYRDGEAFITEATPPPPDSKRSCFRFERGTEGVKSYLERKWASVPREYYLGEWHSHPSRQARPSLADHRQMRQIRSDSNIDCNKPILIVVAGMAKPIPVFSIRVYDGTRDSPEELRGDLNT